MTTKRDDKLDPHSHDEPKPILPGRLGNPGCLLETDPRTDPRLLKVLAPLGLAGKPPASPVTAASPLSDKLQAIAALEAGNDAELTAQFAPLLPVQNIDRNIFSTTGMDGNKIDLYVHAPKNASGLLPCIYHIHGGGMVMHGCEDADYMRWRDELAALGMVVVGVQFRNAAGRLGNYPFPAGLDDCMSGLRWTYENKSSLGIDKIIVSGESGGGNLSLALNIRAKKEGLLHQFAGTFAMSPYISGAYEPKVPELTSLFECDEYFFSCTVLGAMASVYDPDGKNARNPECWPYWATEGDLAGLPPIVISVTELDPLRDEGLAIYQTLLASNVRAHSRTVNGISHAADDMFPIAIPEIYAATTFAIAAFARSV